jgi:hypothetical protein
MAVGILSALENYFYEQGQTYTRAEISALIAGAVASEGIGASDAIFTVENTDSGYEDAGINCSITDIRLIGKTGYPVFTTQSNVQFRPADLSYNTTTGTVTITGFNLLTDQVITIFSVGTVGSDTSSLSDRLTAVEAMLAVVANSSTVMIWIEPDLSKSPPAGFVEVTDYTGRFLVGVVPGDPAMGAVGDIGGDSTVTLSIANLPPHAHTIQLNENGTGNSSLYPAVTDNNSSPKSTGTTSSIGSADPFSIIPKFSGVRYIKWTGL